MRRDHFGFFLFLVLLLIAPKLPLNFSVIPTASTLSLGFVGLLIWGILSPRHLFRIRRLKGLAAPWVLVLFAIYAFGVSLASGSLIAVAYAGQYLFYVLFGFLLLSGYFNRAIKLEQMDMTVSILRAVGLIFALAVIVSGWIGPIYTHQVLEGGRTWGGLELTRGVGFSENVNSAGAVLIVFLALVLFIGSKTKTFMRWLPLCIVLAALFFTISRSAIFAFFMVLLLLATIKFAKFSISGKGTNPFVASTWLAFLLIVFAYSSFIFDPGFGLESLLYSLAEGFGLGPSSTLGIDATSRVGNWIRGLDAWGEGSPVEIIFGKGFHGSQSVSSRVWVTPHNAYVNMLGDFGLVGLSLFLLPMIWLVTLLLLRVIRMTRANIESFGFLSLAAMMVHNMSGSFYYSPVIISLTMILAIFPRLLSSPQSGFPTKAGIIMVLMNSHHAFCCIDHDRRSFPRPKD